MTTMIAFIFSILLQKAVSKTYLVETKDERIKLEKEQSGEIWNYLTWM